MFCVLHFVVVFSAMIETALCPLVMISILVLV